MWLHKIPMCRFLLFRLLIVGLTLSRILEASEETRETKVTFEKTSSISDRSVHETTTPASLLGSVTDSDRELTSPTVQVRSRNDSNVFKPSQHLGEIEEPATRALSPFNNMQHVRFENNVHMDAQHERIQSILQDTSRGIPGLLDEVTRSSRIKFQDDDVMQTSNVRHSLDDQQIITESSRSQFEEGAVGHVFVDQTFFPNVERPEMQNTFGKTMIDHRPTGIYYDAPKSPYVVSYYADQNQNAYRPTSQETAIEVMKRPESNGVMVLQQHESTYTRKRKFPYPFYQPTGEYHDVQYMEDPHATMAHPRVRKPFPWKKIIHLIGAILPLGLLLATLKPNVVQIGNATTTNFISQPNIVLSKLRLADLPVEHKRARIVDDQSIGCENQSICEMILAGGEPQSNMLQTILWNLATRTPDDVAKRNGLHEVFSAIRKKDCAAISC